jgi:hypothetical protein
MAKILLFPTKAVRDRAEIEVAARRILDGMPLDADAKEIILGRFKNFIELCNRQFDFNLGLEIPVSVSPADRELIVQSATRATHAFDKPLNDFLNELLGERLHLEVARYLETAR